MAVRHAVAYKVATSGAESSPTFSGATDDWLGACVVVRDADTTNPFGATPTDGTDYNTTAYSLATSYASGALTTGADGALIFRSFGQDGTGATSSIGKFKINDCRGVVRQSGSALISQYVGFEQQESSGAVATPTFYFNGSAAATGAVIAVRNKSGGALCPDIRPTVDEYQYYGGIGASHSPAVTWQSPSNFAATINSITCSSTAFRINVDAVDMLFENVNASTPLVFTDLTRRLYRSDGTSIIAPTSYSIHNDYSGVPDVVETGVSGLTGPESAQLMGLPSASSTASAVLTAAQSAPIYADVRKVLGDTVTGSGTEADPWGPA